MQPGIGVQLGNLFMTRKGQLLINSDSLFTLAHLIPAIVVHDCVTTMVGLLLMLMTRSSSQCTTGSRVTVEEILSGFVPGARVH